MGHRIVVVTQPTRLHLDLFRLQIEQDGQVREAIPVEDLAIVIVESLGTTITREAMAALAEGGVAVVFCDERHTPVSIALPLAGTVTHARTFREQVRCTLPKQKRLWQQIVVAKVQEQAAVLREVGRTRTAKRLAELAGCVRSGDPDNVEGQAARLYFPSLFGRGFSRDRGAMGTNSMLNYGYAIVRAMVARALVGAGLHPALGIHHCGPYNPFNLVDDAMEPLRPLVDLRVWRFVTDQGEPEELTPPVKRYLLELTVCPVIFAGLEYPILTALERYAANLRQGICADARKLEVPRRPNSVPSE